MHRGDDSDGLNRRFFINAVYDTCSGDIGWLMVKDLDASFGCSQWDPFANVALPFIKYASGTTRVNFATGNYN